MYLVNTDRIEWKPRRSPSGKFARHGRKVSEALGRQPDATDFNARHPFDVEIVRVPAGAFASPYHSHSAQWEFYHVISGSGIVRHESGRTPIQPGDAFLFKPGEAHQILNDGDGDLVYYVIADNPIGESYHYPDSGKWGVQSPRREYLRGEPVDYFDGED